jgi:PPK2 family polyphosphate:nucleotide phosphotransferase
VRKQELQELHRIGRLIQPFHVKPGSRVRLSRDFDPGFHGDYVKKGDAGDALARGVAQLAQYQDRLAAQSTYAVLVVLQALDAAGKDGTIKHVMSGVNPQGVSVTSFKVPSAEELNHDYLWRYARRLPERGRIGIFNRSHYEEVLVVRVHPENLDRQHLPARSRAGDVWKRRFREINDWERYLVDNGVRIVKLFLNVSREEQRRRFMDRIDTPEKNWKFSAADARERERWDDYQRAYSDVLSNTSSEWAPWHVIPADHKWFARLAVGAVILHELMRIDPHYPEVAPEKLHELQDVRSALTRSIERGDARGHGHDVQPNGLERPAHAASAREN